MDGSMQSIPSPPSASLASLASLLPTLCILSVIVGLLLAGATARASVFTYTTDWLGNTFSGTNNSHVPNGIDAIAVTPAGTTYANCWYDEAAGEVSAFDTSPAWITFSGNLHGFGRSGGYAIAVNNTYVYVAMSQAENGNNPIESGSSAGNPLVNGNNLPQDPVSNSGSPAYTAISGNIWYCVRRYTLAGGPTAIPTYGYGSDESYAIVNTTESDSQLGATNNPDGASIGTAGPISGIAANNSYLFVSDFPNNKIHIYNASTMAPVATWAGIPGPGAMAIDGNTGILWVVENENNNTSSSVVGYNASITGTATSDGGSIACGSGKQVGAPNALAVDSSARLLIADNGVFPQSMFNGTAAPYVMYPKPDVAQIAVYTTGTGSSTPAYSYTFGQSVFSGTASGTVTPMGFNGITGLGFDGGGNFYVSCTGDPHDVGSGTYIRKFNSDAPTATQTWQITGLQFIAGGSLDPGNLNEFYSSYSGYSMNWNNSPPGGGTGSGTVATWNIDTFNPGFFPTDKTTSDITTDWLIPGNAGDNAPLEEDHPMVFEVRDIGGKPFLFTDAQAMGNLLGVMRMNGNIAVPACLFGFNRAGWPADVLPGQCYYWNDQNGDGCMQSSEFVAASGTTDNPLGITLCGKWIDDNANIWTVNRVTSGAAMGGIVEITLASTPLNSYGVPQYNFSTPKKTWVAGANNVTTDNDWVGLVEPAYLPATDTMILAGNTTAHNTGVTNNFDVIRAYPKWSTATTSNKIGHAWEADDSGASNGWKGLYAVGAYVFASASVNNVNAINVYALSTGLLTGTFTPSGVSPTGLNDEDNPINARVLPDGSYVIFQENDLTNNNTIYRWTPGGAFPTTNVVDSDGVTEIQATGTAANQINQSAFSTNVAAAYKINLGGVVELYSPGSVLSAALTSAPSIVATYGSGKTLTIGVTGSCALTTSPGPTSGTSGTTNCLSAPVAGPNLNDLTFAIGPVVNGLANEDVTTFSFALLPETLLSDVTVTVTATFSDNSTSVVTRAVNSATTVFFGFVAPSGTWISSVSLVSDSTVPGTTNIDDVGFITSVVGTFHTTNVIDPNGHTLVQATSDSVADQTNQSAFSTNVATAYGNNMGGVVDFDVPGDALTAAPAIVAKYGSGKTLSIRLTGSSALAVSPLQPPSGTSGTTNCLSAPNAAPNLGCITFTVGTITGGLPGEEVTSLAFTYLTQSVANGIALSATATFSDNSTSVVTQSINRDTSSPIYDTFFGFVAPSGKSITSVSLASTTTRADTTYIDDVGFITQSFAPLITSTLTATGTAGCAFQYSIGATNTPTSYSATGLPAGLSINTGNGLISGTVAATGTVGVTINAVNSSGSATATLTLDIVPTNFATWASHWFTSTQLGESYVSGDLANPSGDGICNLLDYAFNLAPLVRNSQSSLPQASVQNSHLVLTYIVNESAGDLTYIVQVSSDLENWYSGTSYTSNPVVLSGNGLTETVQVTDLTPTSAANQRFIRLFVTQQ
jgi:hypothetical protein